MRGIGRGIDDGTESTGVSDAAGHCLAAGISSANR